MTEGGMWRNGLVCMEKLIMRQAPHFETARRFSPISPHAARQAEMETAAR
jgi:hypothetical protein